MKTLNLNSIAILGLFLFITALGACRRTVTTPPVVNEEELVTTLQLLFTDSAGVQPAVTALYKDTDGDGGAAPSMWDTISLKPNTTYNVSILLLNETVSPADTISNEVLEEADEHLFCFTASGVNIAVQRTDLDANNLEIGLLSKWTTGSVSNGTMQVVLRHQPDQKNGQCDPGASDIDVTFQAKLQ